MKKILSVLLCISLILSFAPISFGAEAESVRVYINGEILSVRGKLYMDNTVIPVRAFLEKAGFTVEWSDAENKVTAAKDSYVMKLWPGSDRMEVNGRTVTMSCPLLEEEGTTYAPVRSIGENTGFEVEWYEKSFSAVLNDGSDSITYYDNTTALLPELGSVVGGDKFSEIAEDSDYGIYYTYANCTEDKAHEYGEYITSKLGYEYDSMLLGENYSKIYIYTLDDVETNIIVQKTEDVPYVYIFPDVNITPKPTGSQYEEETPYEENIPGEEDIPDKNQPSDGNEHYGDVECYPDTTIPKFNAVIGTNLIRTDKLQDGETVYVYEGNDFDVMSYRAYLRGLGFIDYDMDIGTGFNITYTMVKGNQYIMIMSSMFFNEVYVVPVTE